MCEPVRLGHAEHTGTTRKNARRILAVRSIMSTEVNTSAHCATRSFDVRGDATNDSTPTDRPVAGPLDATARGSFAVKRLRRGRILLPLLATGSRIFLFVVAAASGRDRRRRHCRKKCEKRSSRHRNSPFSNGSRSITPPRLSVICNTIRGNCKDSSAFVAVDGRRSAAASYRNRAVNGT